MDSCTIFQMAISARFDGETPADGSAGDAPSVAPAAHNPIRGDGAAFAGLDGGHEQTCPACQAFRQTIERLRQPLRETRESPLPAPIRDRILKSAKPGLTTPDLPGGLQSSQPWYFLSPASFVYMFAFLVFLVVAVPRGPDSQLALSHAREATLAGTLLTLAPKGEAALSLPSVGTLRLWGGPGQVSVDSFTATKVDLTMKSGRLCCNWAKRAPVPFSLRFGSSYLQIVGTTWRLTLEPAGDALIEVAEGKIRMVGSGFLTEVNAMHRVRVSAAGVLSASEAFNPFVDPDLGIPPTQIWIGER